jgi:hypothetical protein
LIQEPDPSQCISKKKVGNFLNIKYSLSLPAQTAEIRDLPRFESSEVITFDADRFLVILVVFELIYVESLARVWV